MVNVINDNNDIVLVIKFFGIQYSDLIHIDLITIMFVAY